MPRETLKYLNVFTSDQHKKRYIEARDCKVTYSECGRGCIVDNDGGYDYLINGRLVSQRAGKSLDTLNTLIAAVLDCEIVRDPRMMADRAKYFYNADF